MFKFGSLDAIVTSTKHVSLDITAVRNRDTLKKFVCNHIEPGTNIIYDGWSGYSFLEDDDAV